MVDTPTSEAKLEAKLVAANKKVEDLKAELQETISTKNKEIASLHAKVLAFEAAAAKDTAETEQPLAHKSYEQLCVLLFTRIVLRQIEMAEAAKLIEQWGKDQSPEALEHLKLTRTEGADLVLARMKGTVEGITHASAWLLRR